MIFLSTLSLRRATHSTKNNCIDCYDFYPRSPCGERPSMPTISSTRTNFYPRSPCGERLLAIQGAFGTIAISIHALLAESDMRIVTKNTA